MASPNVPPVDATIPGPKPASKANIPGTVLAPLSAALAAFP